LSDKRVRQAMHYALDVPAVIRSLFAGLGKPMAGALADTDFGYDPAIKPYPYEVVADMWSKVGIRAKVAMMEMGARQRMVNERALPAGGLLLINVQSTLLDADGSLWRIMHPTGLGGKYWAGSRPGHRFHDVMEQARYALDPKKRKALGIDRLRLARGDTSPPRWRIAPLAGPGCRC
jgi:ABC-type transport system substrate-binding protein